MPEDSTGRSWFSYRYAFPGFAFIIFVVLANSDMLVYSSLWGFLSLDLAAIISFLTFLSGPAVGFIVTQGYYLLVYAYIRKWFFNGSWEKLKKAGIVKERSTFMADIDYWACTKIRKTLFDYLTRRWDLFHVLNSTAYAIVISMITGYCLRFFGFTKLVIDSFADKNTLTVTIPLNVVWVVHALIVSVAIVSSRLLAKSALIVRNEHQNMLMKIVEEQKPEFAFPARDK